VEPHYIKVFETTKIFLICLGPVLSKLRINSKYLESILTPKVNRHLELEFILSFDKTGPWSFILRVKELRNIKELGSTKYSFDIRGFCYIQSLYNEVPLYCRILSAESQKGTISVQSMALAPFWLSADDMFVRYLQCTIIMSIWSCYSFKGLVNVPVVTYCDCEEFSVAQNYFLLISCRPFPMNVIQEYFQIHGYFFGYL